MKQHKIIAYITGSEIAKDMDLSQVTHVNYAFGWVTENQIQVAHPEALSKLREVSKRQNVKLLLSLQQRGDLWFCQRSKTAEGRKLMAQQARTLLDLYDLDGIDVDWEYPGINIATGEHTCDTCITDFVDLLKELRDVLPDKLLTFACPAVPDLWQYTDYERATPLLDYINVMGYDYNWSTLGSSHQSNLYPGTVGMGDHEQCGDRAIKQLMLRGVPAEKLNLGVPFYGYVSGKGASGFLQHGQIEKLLASGECQYGFDEGAKQSYLIKDGEFYCCYDSPETIAAKGAYVKTNGLGGIMYWTYNQDDEKGTLRKAVYEALR